MNSAALGLVVLVVGLWALMRSEAGRGLVLVVVGAVVIMAAPAPWLFLGFVLVAAGLPAALEGGR